MNDSDKTNPISRLAEMRETYLRSGLSEAQAHEDPLVQFQNWFADAVAAQLKEPNAMTLATVGSDGRPSARVVLLKGVHEGDFIFYTNYESRKGRELERTPYAALVFFWAELERQVRVEGKVRKVERERSVEYFHSRPRGSQLGACVSAQSSRLVSREELERRLHELKDRYADVDEIPVPEHWGGYRVTPSTIEFLQGRENRLHDRLEYTRSPGGWTKQRLSP